MLNRAGKQSPARSSISSAARSSILGDRRTSARNVKMKGHLAERELKKKESAFLVKQNTASRRNLGAKEVTVDFNHVMLQWCGTTTLEGFSSLQSSKRI